MILVTKKGIIRSPKHLGAIRAVRLCVACGKSGPVDAAHIRFHDPKHDFAPVGIGKKPDDWRATPLCRNCHEKQHSMSERKFWEGLMIDPYVLAMDLWEVSPDVFRMKNITIRTNFYGECVR